MNPEPTLPGTPQQHLAHMLTWLDQDDIKTICQRAGITRKTLNNLKRRKPTRNYKKTSTLIRLISTKALENMSHIKTVQQMEANLTLIPNGN